MASTQKNKRRTRKLRSTTVSKKQNQEYVIIKVRNTSRKDIECISWVIGKDKATKLQATLRPESSAAEKSSSLSEGEES